MSLITEEENLKVLENQAQKRHIACLSDDVMLIQLGKKCKLIIVYMSIIKSVKIEHR